MHSRALISSTQYAARHTRMQAAVLTVWLHMAPNSPCTFTCMPHSLYACSCSWSWCTLSLTDTNVLLSISILYCIYIYYTIFSVYRCRASPVCRACALLPIIFTFVCSCAHAAPCGAVTIYEVIAPALFMPGWRAEMETLWGTGNCKKPTHICGIAGCDSLLHAPLITVKKHASFIILTCMQLSCSWQWSTAQVLPANGLQ